MHVFKTLMKQLKSLRVCKLLLFFVLLASSLHAKYPRHIIINSPEYVGGGGLFHNFNVVLGYLDLYDKHPNLSISIDMADRGLYFEPSKGRNWWSYYFETLHYPNRVNSQKRPITKHVSDYEKGSVGNGAHYYLTRDRGCYLIEKYITFKKDILDEVEEFYQKHLEGYFVIAIHFRGTDKNIEASHVDYGMLLAAIDEELKEVGQQPYRLFLATDELSILEMLKQDFPETLVYTDAIRMNCPIHYNSRERYRMGREAVIDALLLSKGNTIIKTNSNMSAVSCFINPKMKLVNLNYLNDRLYFGGMKNGKFNEMNQRP